MMTELSPAKCSSRNSQLKYFTGKEDDDVSDLIQPCVEELSS